MMMARCGAILRTLAAILCILAPGSLAKSSVSQDTIKAAFLYRFASFVQWPPGAFPSDQTPIRVCIVGASVFASLLESVVSRPQIDGRTFEVRALPNSAAARECHVVYVTGSLVEETLRVVRGYPVLTVTDAASASTRGMIHFVIVQDRVRFHIDDARAAEGGLFVSSRMLSLAISVRAKAR